MADKCLIALAKNGNSFLDTSKVREFFCLWHSVNKYIEDILVCIRWSSSHGNNPPNKANRKEVLCITQVSKKVKSINDPAVAKAAQVMALRD